MRLTPTARSSSSPANRSARERRAAQVAIWKKHQRTSEGFYETAPLCPAVAALRGTQATQERRLGIFLSCPILGAEGRLPHAERTAGHGLQCCRAARRNHLVACLRRLAD